MSGRRLKRDRKLSSRIPFPELPLPSKFRKMHKAAVVDEPKDEPKVLKRRPPTAESEPLVTIDVPEPIIGGELAPEPPKIRDEGDHVVEELDYSDYKC